MKKKPIAMKRTASSTDAEGVSLTDESRPKDERTRKTEERLQELVRAHQALREGEARFSALFNQTTGGIAQTDLTGRLMLVNDRARTDWGKL